MGELEGVLKNLPTKNANFLTATAFLKKKKNILF